jgi:hypothetical protein
MVVRRRTVKRRRSRRRQRGGGVLDSFHFRYFVDDKHISAADILGKPRAQIILLSGEGIDETHHCALDYVIQGEGVNQIAYLEGIECTTKSDNFQPLSYLIIKKLMDILTAKGIDYIYLTVAPNRFGERKYAFHKLYHFYRTMGFVCLPVGIDPATNAQPVASHYAVHKSLPDFLETANKSNKNTNNANVNKLIKLYYISCGKMIGKVSEIKDILERQINETAMLLNMMGNLGE